MQTSLAELTLHQR